MFKWIDKPISIQLQFVSASLSIEENHLWELDVWKEGGFYTLFQANNPEGDGFFVFNINRRLLNPETFRRIAQLLENGGSNHKLAAALRDMMVQLSQATAWRLPGRFGMRRFRIGRLYITYDIQANAYWIQFDPTRQPVDGRTDYQFVSMRHFWMANAVYDEDGHLFALELLERRNS